MSPEQAKGTVTDQRSDIFSFGCVLYEMLTGRQAFQGETVTEVLASVIKSEPDFALLPSSLNPRIADLARRCLAKDPKHRWHAVADVRMELELILADPRGLTERPEAATAARQPLWRRAVPLAAGGRRRRGDRRRRDLEPASGARLAGYPLLDRAA